VVARTDRDWMAATGPILYSEFYHGEIYDAREELGAWSSPGYDDRSWVAVSQVGFAPDRVIPQDGPPVRRHATLPAAKYFITPRGERVIDFGQNIAGWVRFAVAGSAGERVVLRHAEVLDVEGNIYTQNLRGARNTIEYTLRGGDEERYEPHFTYHGFRYAHVVEHPGEIDPSRFEAVAIGSEMKQTLDFKCSNDLLNRLHHNVSWSWNGNTVDIPTDCPQRDERLGWTGDAQVFMGTASYLADVRRFFRKWLRDLLSEQLDHGGVPLVAPDVLGAVYPRLGRMKDPHSSAGWADAIVLCPWTLYVRYADRRILAETYPAMKAWVEYVRSRARDGVIWDTDFQHGDWLALDGPADSSLGGTPNDFIATAYFAHSTRIVSRVAEILDFEDEAQSYADLFRRINAAFQDSFFTPDWRLIAQTQTAHVLALVFDLVPDARRSRVVDDLARLIQKNGDALTTGFLGTPHLCRALADNGRLDLAYRLLLRTDYPSWLYQVTRGATTVWEHWDSLKPDGTMWSAEMNSFNHYAYGAVGEWIYSAVGGLAFAEPSEGPVRFLFAPRPGGGITWSRISYQSPYGEVALNWEHYETKVRIEARVPPNTVADLFWHDRTEPRTLGSGEHILTLELPAADRDARV